MEKYPVVWGLDIGHSSIKAAKLARTGNGVTVMAYAIEPITVAEDGDRDEAVVKALQQLAQAEDIGGVPVVASLSGRQIFTRTINIPVLNPKKVDKMVELEARQQIPGNFDEVEWGYHLSPAADGASNDVALFAARRTLTEELIRKCKRAGINLVGVSVSSLALYNFVRFDQEFPDDETVIILDVGAENTDLVLYQGETLWMRTLALSGNDITKVFMKKFRVSFEEAETLKRQIGDSRQAEKILKVLEGSLGELTSEVQRSLGFYKSQNPNAKLDNLVISGNTFRLPNLPEYLAERLRYTVNILEDLDKIQVAAGMDRSLFLRDLQSLGVALGLALQGTGLAKANVNLLPSQMQLQRVLKTKRWAGGALVGMVFATWLINYMVYARVIKDNTAMSAGIDAHYKENEVRVESSRKVLARVGPSAATLKSFAVYGGQKGVVHAVEETVLAVMEDLIRENGLVNPGAPPPEEGGEPPLQALFLESLEVTTLKADGDASVFRPLDEPRRAVLKVRIPKKDALRSLPQTLRDRLSAAPNPEYLKSLHPSEKLFSEVQEKLRVDAEDVSYATDPTKIDERTGASKTEIKEFKVPMIVVTLHCDVTNAVVATPPPAAPAKPAKKEAGK